MTKKATSSRSKFDWATFVGDMIGKIINDLFAALFFLWAVNYYKDGHIFWAGFFAAAALGSVVGKNRSAE